VFKRLLLSMVLLFIAGCQPAADPEAEIDLAAAQAELEAEAARDDVRADMLRVLALAPGQADALNAAFDARDKALGDWIAGEKGQRLIALEAEMAARTRASDLDGVRNAIAQAKPLREELMGMVEQYQTAILDTLSYEQRVQWLGFQVSSKLLQLAEGLGLNGAQLAAIEQGGPSAVAQAIQRGEPNPKAAAFLELEKWVEESVLSPEQRAGYAAVKDKNKLRSLGV